MGMIAIVTSILNLRWESGNQVAKVGHVWIAAPKGFTTETQRGIAATKKKALPPIS
jgi:hypothetical protein